MATLPRSPLPVLRFQPPRYSPVGARAPWNTPPREPVPRPAAPTRCGAAPGLWAPAPGAHRSTRPPVPEGTRPCTGSEAGGASRSVFLRPGPVDESGMRGARRAKESGTLGIPCGLSHWRRFWTPGSGVRCPVATPGSPATAQGAIALPGPREPPRSSTTAPASKRRTRGLRSCPPKVDRPSLVTAAYSRPSR